MILNLKAIRWPVQLPLALLVVLGIFLSGTARIPAASATPALRSCDPCLVVTTDRVNLRTGPGKNYPVRTVLPANYELWAFAEVTNGYRQVIYGDTTSWVHGDYLRTPDAPQWYGLAATTSRLNFREGPGTSYKVKAVLPAYSIVKVSDEVVDGFRYVAYNGKVGWVSDAYLGHGFEATTTRKLALRAAPSKSATYLGAVPAWETVTAFNGGKNGYVLVLYNGNVGWVLVQYLG
jgi:uncharacterized protein YgiM (DUF1202 family)